MAVRGARCRLLSGSQKLNLGAHERAIGGVERHQPVLSRVPAGLAVGMNERLREAFATVCGEIHHQECQVVSHVEAAQVRVELDAVDDLRRAVEQHVLGAQVAVNLPDEAPTRTRVEHARAGHHERVRKALQGKHALDLGSLPKRRQQLMEVLGQPPLERRRRRPYGRHGARSCVKARQQLRHSRDLAAPQLAASELRRQRAVLVVAAHLHQIVDGARIVLGRQLQAALARRDRAHPKIDVGRQTAIEAHLLAAHLTTPRRRPVVQEREHDRLLELVRAVACEEHPRDVGLTHHNTLRTATWIEVGAGHGRAQILRRAQVLRRAQSSAVAAWLGDLAIVELISIALRAPGRSANRRQVYWFHLSAVDFPCRLLLARTLVTSAGVWAR